MNDVDEPGGAPDDPGADDEHHGAGPEGDAELDDLEAVFDTVDAALKALDADDLDGAEALAASLGADGGVQAADDDSISPEG